MKKEDLHATFSSIKTEWVMLENVIHFTNSHIVWTLECRCGLYKSSESRKALRERSRGAVLGAERTAALREKEN